MARRPTCPRTRANETQQRRYALKCARLSRDVHGANGVIDELPVMRHLCNLETVKSYEGTENIHDLVVGVDACPVR